MTQPNSGHDAEKFKPSKQLAAMTTMHTQMLAPSAKTRGGKRARGIDVESVWVPYLTSTNVMGITNVASEVLGAPIIPSFTKDGELRVSSSGRPVTRVQDEITEQVRISQENEEARMIAYTGAVMEERQDAYTQEVKAAYAAGQPVLDKASADVEQGLALLRERAMAQARAEADAQQPDDDPSGPSGEDAAAETPAEAELAAAA